MPFFYGLRSVKKTEFLLSDPAAIFYVMWKFLLYSATFVFYLQENFDGVHDIVDAFYLSLPQKYFYIAHEGIDFFVFFFFRKI